MSKGPVRDGDRRTMRERMLAGDWYLADEQRLIDEHVRAAELMAQFNGTAETEGDTRRHLLTELFAEYGQDAWIRPPIYVDYGYNIRFGARSFANYGLVALDVAPIVIGEDCQIATNVQLLTPTHPIDPELRRAKWEAAEPITIGDNVWLGGGAIVLGGVTIGADSIIGAGAVVTHDIPSGVVAVGNPARVIRQITNDTHAESDLS